MSTISISYNSLKDASNEAKSVAKKLDYYADSIKSDIYNKFNNYEGTWSSNITTARNNINSKISELRSKSDKYEKYANNLIGLREECKRTDEAVKKKVSTLTATFKSNHGIKNSKIQNTFSYFMTSIGNSTSAGRWLGNGKDVFDAGSDYLKECIEDWYQFEGGEDFLKGSAIAALEIAIAVITIIGAASTLISAVAALAVGGGVLAIIVAAAALVGGIIAFANGSANLINEGRALNESMNNEPAIGKRRSSENTLIDTIRAESDNKTWHSIADGIEAINFACTVITFVDSFGSILKKGFKWTTGSTNDLKEIKIKNVLTKNNFKDFAVKLKNNMRDGFIEVTTSIKARDWNFFKDMKQKVQTDFVKNFQNKFLDFSDMKKGLKTTKNILSINKELLKGGVNPQNIFKIGINNIALPCTSIANLPIAQGESHQAIVVDDIYKIFKDGYKVSKWIVSAKLIEDLPIKSDLFNKFSEVCNVKVSIPYIHIPQVEIYMDKVKVA